MEELALWFRFVLACMFLSTAWSKHKTMYEHIGIVRDYQILPARLTEPFARVETYGELTLGILLLVGAFQSVVALGCAALLLVYTIAITVNLLRGRTELSCGCGGVAGQHRLSWKLVLRNICLAMAALWVSFADVQVGTIDALLAGAGGSEVFSVRLVVMIGISAATMVAWTVANELVAIEKGFRNFLERKS